MLIGKILKSLDREEFDQWLWHCTETADNYDNTDPDF